MRYRIRLAIDYSYSAWSDRARNIVRLLPRNLPAVQRVDRARLTVSPTPDERQDLRDFFGTKTSHLVWHAPIDRLSLSVEADVERLERGVALDFSPRLERLEADLAAMRSLAADSPHHFTGASPRTAPLPEITAFARDHLRPGQTLLETITTLGQALHREMRFDAGATTVDTTPGEAFAKRHGVCQDFAHVMIAALRGIGLPAGYVSGFLRTDPPPGKPRLEGADAMHAWVRAWAGQEMGWVEYDPTNDCFAGTDFVQIGHGRDYSDVAPVLGAIRSAGGQDSRQAVDVIPLDAAGNAITYPLTADEGAKPEAAAETGTEVKSLPARPDR